MTAQQRHDEIVEQLAEGYRADGYLVDRQPVLEPGLQADLVLRRGVETVVVEVKMVSNRDDRSPSLERLARLAESRGWKFIVAIGGGARVEEIEVPHEASVRARIAEARALPPSSTASVLVAWSAFEAAVRHALTQMGLRPKKGSAPLALVQQVAALGLIDTKEEARLVHFAEERNRLAHGFEGASGEHGEVAFLLDVAGRLLGRQDA